MEHSFLPKQMTPFSRFYFLLVVGLFCHSLIASDILILPPQAQEYLRLGSIMEDGFLSSRGDEQKSYNAFIDYVHENWSEILDDINTVAPYEHQQQLIMAACESLNDRAYIHFLDKVGKLYAKGDINDAVLSVVLNTSEAREGFLALNYDDPSVQSFLKNVRSKMQTTNPASNYINGVLSGKGKKEVLESPDMPFLTVKQKELLQLLIIAGSVVVVVVTALAARYFIIRSRRKI